MDKRFAIERRTKHRPGVSPGAPRERRPGRAQRQAMRHTIQRAQWLSSDAAISGISPDIRFRAVRHSYPDALLVVSDVLSEAQVHAESGRLRAARRLRTLAAQIAWYSGFSELVHLVRAYVVAEL